jgi:hypothetical protein
LFPFGAGLKHSFSLKLANLFLIKIAFLFEEINPVEIKSTIIKIKQKKR